MDASASISIDLASPTPAYRQIADALRAQLVSGSIRAGEQLPTVRELALDLGVHHNTVAEAYRVLAAEGWVDMRRRHGVRVLDREHPAHSTEAHDAFARRLRELAAEARARGVSKSSIADRLRALAQELVAVQVVEE